MKALHLITRILFNIMIVVLCLTILVCTLAANGTEIANLLSENVFDSGTSTTVSTGVEPVYYKTWYFGVDDVLDGNGAVAAAAEAEGAVLLRNENDALPLDKESDGVSVFGVTAYSPMYSLGGAGSVSVNSSGETNSTALADSYAGTDSISNRRQYLWSELEDAGMKVNETLANYYTEHVITDSSLNRSSTNSNSNIPTINGETWSDLPSSSGKTASGYNTAIFVVGRMGTEAADMNSTYLTFTDREKDMLNNLKSEKARGTFKKIILIFNQGNPMQENIEQICDTYDVDAAMWIGYPGSDGLAAVASLLVGDSTPSGGLSDMWYSSLSSNPSTQNYAGSGNVVYQEGVYEGYRYAETRYEDYVMESESAGTYNYSGQVSYPFGWGLSYSDFDVEIESVRGNDDPAKNYYTTGSHSGEKRPSDELRASGDALGEYDDLLLDIKVTNTGETAGKKVVQVYVQQPYTESNKENGVEKVSAQLVGYAKTSKLQPGESETLTIEIDANKYFASYDRTTQNEDGTQGSYILDEGTYFLSVAGNSHEAVNSILKYKKENSLATVDEDKMDSDYGAGDVSLVSAIEVSSGRSASYEYWTQGGATPSNLFDSSDPNVASGDESYVPFMSRSDWEGTAGTTNGKSISISNIGDMGAASNFNSSWNSGDYAFTTANVKKYYPEIDTSVEEPLFNQTLRDENGEEYTINLIEMKGVEYDPVRGASEEDVERWETFMSQLTWDETCSAISEGLRKTSAVTSVNKPATNDVNASNGLQWMFDMHKSSSSATVYGFAQRFDSSRYDQYATGYPCEGIIAASFNNEVAYAVGQALGEDALWAGASGLYGFGLNLHRNPRHGRAGEYYSDDPYLTGMMGGYASLGAESKGLYVYNKHFVLNEQESSRTSYCAWITEQSLRETYLRPFEIAIEVGDAMNVMSSFNNVGSGWSGNNYNLMTAWLRGEAGMAGFAITDYYRSGGMNLAWGVLAGTDLPDGSASGTNAGWSSNYEDDVASSGYFRQAVVQSAQRIMYVVANSNAMNFMGEDTYVVTTDPVWYTARDITEVVVIAAFVGSVALVYVTSFASVMAYRRRKNKKSEKSDNPDNLDGYNSDE